MIKKEKYLALHIDSDTAIDKRTPDAALDILNLEITNNDGLLSLTPINKKEKVSDIPFPSIIGHVEIDKILYFITQTAGASRSALYKMDIDGTISGITQLSVAYSVDVVLDVVGNKENENIIKVYWAGGGEQLCSINVVDPDLEISSAYNPRNMTSFKLSMPKILDTLEGGNLIAGKIQYAYSLFKLHGAETTISPLSLPASVSYNGDGGESGKLLNVSTEVEFKIDLNNTYEYIRIYSIHYQELNQLPKITVIIEEEISNSTLTIIDDGNLFVSEVGVDKFTFLGGTLVSPETIAAKNNRLFAANYTDTSFDVDWINDSGGASTDCRVYSHIYVVGMGTAWGVQMADGTDMLSGNAEIWDVPEKHDAITTNTTLAKYDASGVLGAEGPNFRLNFVTSIADDQGLTKSLKQGETYRFGVVLYNKYMQRSSVKWVADLKIPRYDINPNPNIGVNIKFTGNWAYWDALGIKSYQLVIVKRLPRDRTVSAQGFISVGVNWFNEGAHSTKAVDAIHPSWVLKRITTSETAPGSLRNEWSTKNDLYTRNPVQKHLYPGMNEAIVFFYSMDIIFDVENVQEYDKAEIVKYALTRDSDSKSVSTRFKNGLIETQDWFDDLIYNADQAGAEELDGATPGFFYPKAHTAADNLRAFEHNNFHKYHSIRKANYPDTVDITNFEVLKENSVKFLGTQKVASYIDLHNITENSSNVTWLNATMPNCIALEFGGKAWAQQLGLPESLWTKYLNFANLFGGNDAALPLLELSRVLTNQYGGNTCEAKKRNTYLLNGRVLNLFQTADEYIGDVTIGPLSIQIQDGLDTRATFNWNIQEYVWIPYIENDVDPYSRSDYMATWFSGPLEQVYGTYRLDDNHKLLSAYNQQNDLILGIGKPITFESVAKFEASITVSSVKFPNEVVDSWTEFLPNEVMNLQGTYGSINKLYNFNNEIYSFQDSAVAHILIQPRIQIQTEQAIGVELGTGQILHDYTYLNTKSGTLSKRSIVDDGKILLYYDNNTNTINSHEGEELSTALFIKNLMDTNTPSSSLVNARKIFSVYSAKRNEFIFTMNNNTLIIFNTSLRKFQRKETGGGYLMEFNGKLHSTEQNNSSSSIYEHYKNVDKEECSITYTFAPLPDHDKVFHNIEYRDRGGMRIKRVDVVGINNTIGHTIDPIINEKFGVKRIHLPRVENSRTRFRDTGIKVKLTIEDLTEETSYLDSMVIMFNSKEG